MAYTPSCGLTSVSRPFPTKDIHINLPFCPHSSDEFCTAAKGGAPGTGCQSDCAPLSDFATRSGGVPSRHVIGYYSSCAYPPSPFPVR